MKEYTYRINAFYLALLCVGSCAKENSGNTDEFNVSKQTIETLEHSYDVLSTYRIEVLRCLIFFLGKQKTINVKPSLNFRRYNDNLIHCYFFSYIYTNKFVENYRLQNTKIIFTHMLKMQQLLLQETNTLTH